MVFFYNFYCFYFQRRKECSRNCDVYLCLYLSSFITLLGWWGIRKIIFVFHNCWFKLTKWKKQKGFLVNFFTLLIFFFFLVYIHKLYLNYSVDVLNSTKQGKQMFNDRICESIWMKKDEVFYYQTYTNKIKVFFFFCVND
jgi:hypothetical protein